MWTWCRPERAGRATLMCWRSATEGFMAGDADDKGAAVVALYCLKALKDEKVKCVRKARAIFGAGEEIASDDLKQYFQREVLPELAFTPDAEYGVCNREKGILHVELSAPADGSRLESLHGGTVRNAVAASARAEARCTAEECQALEALSKKMGVKFSFQWSDGVLTAECVGRAAHAMEPQKGRNAAARLVRLFSSCFGGEALGVLWSFVDQKIGLELDGSSLGFAGRTRFPGR
ncbi:M20/M25/M40 family metallo-hydrolase [[Clostridium] leptum]|uniref:M20/M25/M40 family metallo-hydrolase n=1 Tax=[Clostridium] leptum TaxID=1535 RepID=A0A412B0U4_9FIRM|nr:M20/M25/M40 family metallo-hydrolase [[Clostridium] leptum]